MTLTLMLVCAVPLVVAWLWSACVISARAEHSDSLWRDGHDQPRYRYRL
jgi:hypothetical protein